LRGHIESFFVNLRFVQYQTGFYFDVFNVLISRPLYSKNMPRARKIPQQEPESRLAVIGESLQAIRKRRGLTQKELGEKIGLTREAIASYEAGRSHLMDTTLLDMAAALRVSAGEILGLERRVSEPSLTSRRWAKRMEVIESLPESVKKHILRTLDDVIKANTRLSIFEDGRVEALGEKPCLTPADDYRSTAPSLAGPTSRA
jgi:transcriptional regulator with XRE-family HTH domain